MDRAPSLPQRPAVVGTSAPPRRHQPGANRVVHVGTMFGLAQKQTFAPQKAMSALPPIATLIAPLADRGPYSITSLEQPRRHLDAECSRGCQIDTGRSKTKLCF